MRKRHVRVKEVLFGCRGNAWKGGLFHCGWECDTWRVFSGGSWWTRDR